VPKCLVDTSALSRIFSLVPWTLRH